MKKVGNWFAANWMGLLFSLLVGVGLVFLLWFGLGDMLPGLSKNEVSQAAAHDTVKEVVKNPIGLPHELLQYAGQKVSPGAVGIRSASAVIGLFTIGCFYYVLRAWYSRRVAALGTLLLATSAWFLHVARLGTDESMYLLLFAPVACASWLQRSRGSLPAVIASAAVIAGLLYIPGMVWFIVPVLLWQLSRIGGILEGQNTGLLTILSVGVILLCLPIGWAIYQQPDLAKTYFGLPQAFPEPMQVIKDLLHVPIQLFVRGPNNPEVWLGRLPLLSIFLSVMFVIGSYAYVLNRGLDRVKFTAFVLVVGSVLSSLGGPVSIAILLPVVHLVAIGGMAFMLQQWFTVFPRNPFARATGTIVMSALVLLAAFGSFSHYFIAWPNTPETQAVFQQQKP